MAYVIATLHAMLFLLLATNYFYLRRNGRRTPLENYPSVSILIPARNEADNLRRLLPTLQRQDYPVFEVIVYDDGSEDETWEVLQAIEDGRVKPLQGSGPPPGWVGKVHALYQATRHATGTLYLFLDADAALLHPAALRHLVERYRALPPRTVLTGLVRLRGGGGLLVSLVPHALLTGLPWPLVRSLPFRSLGALNGQCWMLEADTYRHLEPHMQVRGEILEDVMIGRYLKEKGITPALVNIQQEVAVYMYRDHADAWQGFRKNAYLIMGGHWAWFVPWATLYALVYLLAPFFWPGYLVTIYAMKAWTDRQSGFPPHLTLLAPLSYLLGTLLQLDSALSHWTGRVSWKGRRVG